MKLSVEHVLAGTHLTLRRSKLLSIEKCEGQGSTTWETSCPAFRHSSNIPRYGSTLCHIRRVEVSFCSYVSIQGCNSSESWFLLLLFLHFKKHLCCFTIISFLNFLQSSAKLLVQICIIQHAFTPFCVPRVTGSCCYELRLIDCCSVALS